MNFQYRYKVKKDSFVIRKVADEMVLVPLVNNVADMTSVITLNETGASIIEALNGKRTLQEVLLQLLEIYNVEEKLLRSDLSRFVTEALNKNIIEPVSQ